MSARIRFIIALCVAAVAVLIIAAPAFAEPQVPPGATVGDGIVCRDGKPEWRVSLANSGPNPTIHYVLISDNYSAVDYDIGLGPLTLAYMPAHNGSSHLTVTADNVPMIDTTQSIECDVQTTTTTTPPTTVPPTTVPPVTTPTTAPVHVQGSASPTTVKAVAHAATADPTNSLPFTGSSSLPLALTGFTLVAAGSAAVRSGRRKSHL
jgi:hypothetical protein